MRTDSALAEHCYDSSPKDTCLFTIKDYKSAAGLSTKFFDRFAEGTYQVKGPLGKGLLGSEGGLHVAFAAGTGILTFMDLVAKIAKVCIEHVELEKATSTLNNSQSINALASHTLDSSTLAPMVEPSTNDKVQLNNSFSLALFVSFNS